MAIIPDYIHKGRCNLMVDDKYIDNTLKKDTVVARIQYLFYEDQLKQQNGKKGREH